MTGELKAWIEGEKAKDVGITCYNLTAVMNNTKTKYLHKPLTMTRVDAVKDIYRQADVDGDGFALGDEVDELLSRLNLNPPSEKMKAQ